MAPTWDERYGVDGFLFGTEPNEFLVACAHLLAPHSRVLAVADGEGRNGVWLAELGHTVTSVDSSPVAQAKARRLAAERDVDVAFVEADVTSWAWPQAQFDAVVAIFIQFAPPAERRVIFDGCTTALVPGGIFLLQGYRPEQLAYGTGGPPTVENLYTEAQLREELAGLHIEALRVHDDEIHEGTGHGGMSALIDVIAYRP